MIRTEILKTAKPILFGTEMVRAIQNDTKTVTRRPIKNNPVECTSKVVNGVCKLCDDKGGFYLPDDYVKARSPYQVGDILYVRETWGEDNHNYLYRADFSDEDLERLNKIMRWRPSIHMPKKAARIFLRVTDIRVERLREITEEQAIAEGFNSRAEFISEFLKIYPSCTEDSWVWVIEIERVEVQNG